MAISDAVKVGSISFGTGSSRASECVSSHGAGFLTSQPEAKLAYIHRIARISVGETGVDSAEPDVAPTVQITPQE